LVFICRTAVAGAHTIAQTAHKILGLDPG